jgi:catechol 2,3-dioxygenase-like lactoylglutathione lyase family enzyme
MSVFEMLPDSAAAPRQLTNELGSQLGLVRLDHVGLVVRDVERAADLYSRFLGLDGWQKMRWSSQVTWRGQRAHVGGVTALANIGTLRVELAQPTIGVFTQSEWLASRGEGVFHIGYLVDDLPDVLQRAARVGWPVELLSEDDTGPEYAYLDPASTCGVCIEVIAERLLAGVPGRPSSV